MTLRRNDDQEVRELLALRPTDDLTDEEMRRVDESLRYSEANRRELADFEKCLAVLHAASEEPSPTDDRPSIWSRVEPQLGPARRFPPRRLFSVPTTAWLTAACMLLAAGNLYLLFGQQGDAKPLAVLPDVSAGPVVPPNGNMLVGNRLPVLVDPRDERGRVRPLLGIFVTPCEGENSPGAVIEAIFSGTSAEDAGLQVGDVLVSIDGKKVCGPGCVVGCLRQHGVGQRIEIVYLREGRRHKVSVFLGGLVKMGDREFLIKKSPIPLDLIDRP
jgi:hypothetical protein